VVPARVIKVIVWSLLPTMTMMMRMRMRLLLVTAMIREVGSEEIRVYQPVVVVIILLAC
jgi:hypothetical protein